MSGGEAKRGEEAEKGGDRRSEAGSVLTAESPMRNSNPQTGRP